MKSFARPTVAAMDKLIGVELKVLDHGFIRVVDYMGDDSAIVQAARVSYGSGTKSLREDAALIRYLLRHGHTTPFEMCELKLHVKMPIFVARQWVRHRTANINEYSGRYSILDKEFYVPEELGVQSQTNKQGRDSPASAVGSEEYVSKIKDISGRAYANYKSLLNDDKGLARELARVVLPVNFYTQWYWKIDLHNLLRFLFLRSHSHAQYEIRVYAQKIIDEVLPKWVPTVTKAFKEYQQGAVSLSASAVETVKKWLEGDRKYAHKGMSKRELDDLKRTLLGKSRNRS